MRVSVLITSYQHERYIARALESVLEQSADVSFEVLVGDDASTDGTRAVIAGLARAHAERIRTFLPEKNLGSGGKAIFAELLGQARGEYIATLDGDDWWTSPAKLRRQVAYLDEHPECSMCFHNVLYHWEDGSRADAPRNRPDQATHHDMEELLSGCYVGSCSPVFRRAAIVPLPAWYFEMPWGDWPLYILAARAGEIHYLPELMGVYRLHQHGMFSGLSQRQVLEIWTTLYEGVREIIPPEYEALRRHWLSQTWVGRALEHERAHELEAARHCLSASFGVRPLNLRRRGTGDKRRIGLWLRLRVPGAVYPSAARYAGK